MGVSKVQSKLTIIADSDDDSTTAYLHYLVGLGLSRWHFVEQDLTMIYLMLVCPFDAPVDGALASFMNVQTTDAKITLTTCVLTQVLYQDCFAEFRKRAKKDLIRIRTLNDTRNKLAHGWVRRAEGKPPAFQPFGNMANDFRVRSLKSLGSLPGIIVEPQYWDTETLRAKVESLGEGPEKSHALWRDLVQLFEDERTTLEKTPRMTLDRGIPFDPNSRDTPLQA